LSRISHTLYNFSAIISIKVELYILRYISFELLLGLKSESAVDKFQDVFSSAKIDPS